MPAGLNSVIIQQKRPNMGQGEKHMSSRGSRYKAGRVNGLRGEKKYCEEYTDRAQIVAYIRLLVCTN